jgi:hypothetical protein
VSKTTKKALAIGAVLIVILAVAGWQLRKSQGPRVRELAGATLTMIDAAKGSAEIEFVHPKSGRKLKLTGTMAPGCQILIDGQPAQLADVRVGDVADLKGTVYSTFSGYSVQADRVSIRRSSSQPALPVSQPAGS